MNTVLPTRFLNIALRGTTLVSKFAFVLVLARFLPPSDIGLYGLLSATIAFCAFITGSEFYTYSMREMISAEPSKLPTMLVSQLCFHGWMYALFFPMFLLVFWLGWLPWQVLLWFYLLLPLEHITQELNRVLVALSMQVKASFVLFIGKGLWCLLLIPCLWLFPASLGLEIAFSAWAVGSGAAGILGIYWVLRRTNFSVARIVDRQWIYRGLTVALPMFVASSAIFGLFTFDRYWVKFLGGFDALGAYVLYAGMANAVVSFLDAGVVVFFYPKLVKAARENDQSKFLSAMKELSSTILAATTLLTGSAFLVGFLVVRWIDKPIYTENFHMFKLLLVAMFVYGINYISHLGLYARNKDGPLIFSQVAALVLFTATMMVFGDKFGVNFVPIALCVAFILMLIWKGIAYLRMKREWELCE